MVLSDCNHWDFPTEGIMDPNDLPDFTKEGIEAIFDNIQKTPKEKPTRNCGKLVEVEPLSVSDKSNMRLLVAIPTAKYYEMTSGELNKDNLDCALLRKNYIQCKSLK